MQLERGERPLARGERLEGQKRQQQPALHVGHAGAVGAPAGVGEWARRRGAAREHRVVVAEQHDAPRARTRQARHQVSATRGGNEVARATSLGGPPGEQLGGPLAALGAVVARVDTDERSQALDVRRRAACREVARGRGRRGARREVGRRHGQGHALVR